ncbi:MAG: hypothetical protein KIT58_14540, partial [Planctomycetota bacterium]|nr:hypothetical protein [Planctomycetota bacterium]
ACAGSRPLLTRASMAPSVDVAPHARQRKGVAGGRRSSTWKKLRQPGQDTDRIPASRAWF